MNLSRKVAFRYCLSKTRLNGNRIASLDVHDMFNDSFGDVASALFSEPEIVMDILEDLLNSQKLSITEDGVFYQNTRIL